MGQLKEAIHAKAAKVSADAGAYDQHGNKLNARAYAKARRAGDKIYNSREEALDTRVSEGVETKKDNKSVFGGKRANLFGN